jgi:NADPH:quinone reductase-like Zn-dependent oxidoreductase
MLRAQYERRGSVPQDVIHAVELATPEPAAGQALLEVVAAPINPSDVLTLTGEYADLPPLPAVGGREGVGRVADLGPDTEGPAVGRLVLLPRGCGSWSSHVVAEATQLVELPNDADPQQLAMMTINPPTAALLLSEFVRLDPGEWVIQNAANSAVGIYLVQLARERGQRTVNVVRREDATAMVKAAGGDAVVTDGNDLAGRVAEATGGAAIRLGIDAIGGGATGRLADCLSRDAILVNYGRMSGELADWFRTTPASERVALLHEIAALIANGTLHAPIHATYDVSEIKEAVAVAASGGRSGKVLIVPRH